MFISKSVLRAAGASLAAIVSLVAQPLAAQTSSESKEIEELRREVAELRAEVNSLKKQPEPHVVAEGPTKTEISYDGKKYVEKTVPLEKSAADKWKLSTSITELELYGDLRLRYDYRGGETKSTGPVASPGAGVAGVNDWQERERERYRIRLGLRGTLLDDWFFGVRLETNNSARSTNVTFGDDTASSTPGGGGPFEKNSDIVYVGQAYGGYKGFPGFTLTAGRMPNPLVIDTAWYGTRTSIQKDWPSNGNTHLYLARNPSASIVQQGWQSRCSCEAIGAVPEARSLREFRTIRL